MPRRPSREPDLSPTQVARALGYADVRDFVERADDYRRRGLIPDPITGRYDPEAFDRWRRLRSPSLFPELLTAAGGLTAAASPAHVETLVDERLRRM